MVIGRHIHTLKELNTGTLSELISMVSKLDKETYLQMNDKGNASVGQHVRHTIEFYQCLFQAEEEVDYDARSRNVVLETDQDRAIEAMDRLLVELKGLRTDRELILTSDIPKVSETTLRLNSSLVRELMYVLEHAIHHMALMRIIIKDIRPDFELTDSFGVAYSTLAFRDRTLSN